MSFAQTQDDIQRLPMIGMRRSLIYRGMCKVTSFLLFHDVGPKYLGGCELLCSSVAILPSSSAETPNGIARCGKLET